MLQLQGKIRDYAWGSLTAIPELMGSDPTGDPQAEYWLGGHPLAPATLDGVGLDTVFKSTPQWFGVRDDRYPVLMKILAADHPLSLQAHPDRDQAQVGFDQENLEGIPLDAPNRIYRDPWAKPEIIVALTDFDVLCGFRDPATTVDLFKRLGVGESFARVIAPLSMRKGSPGFAEVFLNILSHDHPNYVEEVLHLAHQYTEDDTDLGEFARTATELNHFFPQHRSILAALLLNRIHLEPGQGLFIPTRTLHSYLGGVGVEVMGCSDNVLRGGLTKKHISVDELIRVVDFSPCEMTCVDTTDEAGFTRYLTESHEFILWRGDLASEPIQIPGTDTCRIVLVVEGEAELSQDDTTLELIAGQAVLLPVGEKVTACGSATIFIGAPGVTP
ncbi:MAG: mannose-6-phosphate isomerase, class I [Propionibacteriaceae bacterium]|nr:mannose-6-phosphate isomerase, class I [Propionibacteriaceae bacterium]